MEACGKSADGVGQGSPPQILLVICDLNDNGYLEDLLEPDIEHEGDEVTQMKRF